MKTNTLSIINDSGIERAKAESIWIQFEPLLDKANNAAAKVSGLEITDISQVEEMKLARRTRIELKNIRCEAENTRKTLKEDIVKEGRFIDNVAKLISDATRPIEEDLRQKEEFAEIKERERIAEIVKSRTDALYAVGYDSRFVSLAKMSNDEFCALLENATNGYKERIAEERVAAEKSAAEERARIEAENARLRTEAEEREKERAKERAEAEARLAEEAARIEAERKRLEQASDKGKIMNYLSSVISVYPPKVKSDTANAIIDAVRKCLQIAIADAERM